MIFQVSITVRNESGSIVCQSLEIRHTSINSVFYPIQKWDRFHKFCNQSKLHLIHIYPFSNWVWFQMTSFFSFFYFFLFFLSFFPLIYCISTAWINKIIISHDWLDDLIDGMTNGNQSIDCSCVIHIFVVACKKVE